VAGSLYFKAISSSSEARLVQTFRYISTGIVFVLIQGTALVALWAWQTNPRIARGPALFIIGLALLLTVPIAYRLVVMRFQTTALESTAPGSLNSSASKLTFYMFHMAPEFVTAAALFSVNLREMYRTGPLGHGE